MAKILLDLPDSVLQATGQTEEELGDEARFLLLVRLFERGLLSSGRAAELLACTRVEFLFRAGQAGVPLADLDDEGLEREFAVV